MTKEEAKKELESWIIFNTNEDGLVLPEVDVVVYSQRNPDYGTLEEWTFKGLLRLAYDL